MNTTIINADNREPTGPVEGIFVCASPEEAYELGIRIAGSLRGGEALFLHGGLGAGKTLMTKGVLDGLGYDPDEVNSPSFTLVNLYRTERFDVYHIDLWRLDESSDAGFAVGLPEILEDETAVVIIEWPERLRTTDLGRPAIRITIEGDGDDPRKITVSRQ